VALAENMNELVDIVTNGVSSTRGEDTTCIPLISTASASISSSVTTSNSFLSTWDKLVKDNVELDDSAWPIPPGRAHDDLGICGSYPIML
jgi:hypothetical protein